MQRNAGHLFSGLLHESLRPVVIIIGSTAGNLIEGVSRIIVAVGDITLIDIGIVVGSHVSAAAPGLVADTEELYVPRLLTAVLLAELRHGTALCSHVLDPFRHFLDGA